MYLFTQQLYIINKSKVTLISCLLIFLFIYMSFEWYLTFCWLNKFYWYSIVFINVLYLPVISLLSSKPTISHREHFSVWLVCIDLFILKNMGAAIIDFRVCPPLVKCKNIMFSGFIDTLMYGFSSTGVTIYCYFGLKFNDNTCCEMICKWRYNDNDIMTTNKLPGMYIFFLITIIFPIQNQYKSYLIKNCMHFFSFFCCFSSIRKKG